MGQALRNYRVTKGVPQETLASMLGVPREQLASWESGSESPTAGLLGRLGEILGLSSAEAAHLRGLDQAPPSQGPLSSTSDPGSTARDTDSGPGPRAAASTPQLTNQLRAHIADLEALLRQAVTEQSAAADSPGAPWSARDVADALRTVKELRQTSELFAARVVPPPPQDMELRLVTLDSFQRLEEYRSDQNHWTAVAGVLFGAILGVVVNITTGGRWTMLSISLTIILTVFAGLAGLTARTYTNRANLIKHQLAEAAPPPPTTQDA
jgi:transcriptional regulator with XRE-family HTH domain